MATKFEKLIAKQELRKRQIEKIERDERTIMNMTTRELEKLLEEPEEEATDSPKPVKSNERTTDLPQAGSEPKGKPNE